MFLRTIEYNQNLNTSQVWSLKEFPLGQINLLVGQNATGKSRTLNVIGALANLLSGDTKMHFKSGSYIVRFENGNSDIKYSLSYEEAKVLKEELIVNRKVVLKRGVGGKGRIYFKRENKTMSFQTPDNELACVARRDSLQHPFFEDLYQWGKQLRHYYFGTSLGQDIYVVPKSDESQLSVNQKDTINTVLFFKKGHSTYGKAFDDSIKKDMKSVGYKINEIGLGLIPGIKIIQGPATALEGLYVKEADLKGVTYQNEISQGMFRVLSLIIQLNFAQLESNPSCILIDDIGEGLDYDRSTALITLLIEKIKSSTIQIIMSTNDRFVMNNVPLEYWSIIQRDGGQCKILNYRNSKKVFDEFAYTGLANFDFLASQFYLKGLDEK